MTEQYPPQGGQPAGPPSYPGPVPPPGGSWAGQPAGPSYPGPVPPPGGPWAGQPGTPWAGQPPVPPRPVAPTFPHPEPTPYHQMLRTWSYAAWKPIVGVLLAVLAFLVLTAVVYLVVALVAAAFASGSYIDAFMRSADFTDVRPSMLLALNLGLASLVPATWVILRVLHRMRPRWLTSVVPRMRWRFFAVCLGLAVVALVAQVVVGQLIPGSGEDDLGSVNTFTTATALSALVVLLTTPLQAAGEEYLFRGYLLMAVGSIFPRAQEVLAKWVAIVVTALVFAAAHGSQNFPLFFDRFAFGLIAAWLVIRTGGLEAGLALHILNNFLAFGIALAFGSISDSLSMTSASWWQIVLTVTQSGIYTLLVVLVARKMGLQTRTRPPLPAPDRPAGPAYDSSVATA